MKLVIGVPPERFEAVGMKFPEDWEVVQIQYPYTVDMIRESCKDADILMVRSVDVVTKEMLEAAPSLKMIHTSGVSYDKIDYEAAAARGIPVCHCKGGNSLGVAEHTIGLMLNGLRRTNEVYNTIMKKGYADGKKYALQHNHELASAQVGVIGFGAIGKQVASRLKPWGCKVVYYDPYRPSKEVEEELNVEYMDLDDLIRTSDIISIHLPVLPSTRGMINRERIAMMKKDALFINVARGEVMDNEAVAEALEAGRIYVACDVIAPEPPAPDHPLLNMSEAAQARFILTPHIAGATTESSRRCLKIAFDDMMAFLKDGTVNNRVN